jgi:hypothetical protein
MEVTDKVRLDYYIKFDKAKSIFERVAYHKFRQSLDRTTFEAIKAGTTDYMSSADLFEAYFSVYEMVFKRYAKRALGMQLKADDPIIGIGFFSRLFRSKVSAYLATTAGERITNVNENTKAEVRKVLDKYKFQGSYKAARAMKNEITIINKNRANLIARTESLTAMNHISHESAKNDGVTSKAWLHSIGRSKDYRESHLYTASHEPIPINQKWNIGGVEMDFPGDPNGGAENNCNCRCSVLYGYDVARQPDHGNLFESFIQSVTIFNLVK